MLIENAFELVIILLALVYSRFARLPLMVACNIFIYSYITLWVETNFEVTESPGYDIFYAIGGGYLICAAIVFLLMGKRLYKAVAMIMFLQASASGIMLLTDSFWQWHEFINDKSVVIECFIVWLSTIGLVDQKDSSK